MLIQSLHAFTFGHYLVIYYVHANISENNKLLLHTYHALSSGTMMTILTILAGFFLIMAPMV